MYLFYRHVFRDERGISITYTKTYTIFSKETQKAMFFSLSNQFFFFLSTEKYSVNSGF